jgi:hypothetical protein
MFLFEGAREDMEPFFTKSRNKLLPSKKNFLFKKALNKIPPLWHKNCLSLSVEEKRRIKPDGRSTYEFNF